MTKSNSKFQEEVWTHNYKGPNDKGVEDTWHRIAKAISKAEKTKKKRFYWENQFYEILKDWHFSPGGRISANAGIESREHTTLMNCYVHSPRDLDNFNDVDSIPRIYDLVKAQAETLKSEGGYGMNFSWLRPSGAYIKGIGARTPGVLKFMELWDKSAEIITQGSDKILGDGLKKDEKLKIRKGAQMGILDIWHPDIEDFIVAKQTAERLTKFNLSVGVTAGFMEAVNNNHDWHLMFPDTEDKHYKTEWDGNLVKWLNKGYPAITHKKIKARKLWDLIMKSTYMRNEPGVLFLDKVNKLNALNYNEEIVTANPCGEITMSLGVCNLASLNLVKFFDKTKPNKFDFDKFKKYINVAIRFLDNVNDIAKLPLPEYKKAMVEKRRIGLGIMGLGSLLFMMKIRYGSEKSWNIVKKIFKVKAETEILASAKLGKEKGSFKHFNKSKYFKTYWWKNLEIDEDIKHQVKKIGRMRNSHRSAIAPTGNTSVYSGVVSGGLEPIYMKEYTRWTIVVDTDKRKLKNKGLEFPNTNKGEWFETKDFTFTKKGDEEILQGTFEGRDYEIDKNRGLVVANLIEDYGWSWIQENCGAIEIDNLITKGIFDTTTELNVEDHINILKIVAHYTDLSISKTINLPENYPFAAFKNLYYNAWKVNIKGVTTYRANTMTAVLEEQKTKKYQSELEKMFEEANGDVLKTNVKLPKEYYSKGYIIKDQNKKKWYVNLAFADSKYNKPYALFIHTNSHESSEVADKVINDMEVLCLDKGIDKQLITYQREKYAGQSNVNKIARAIGMALRHNIQILEIVQILENNPDGFSTLLFHIKKLLSKFIEDGTRIKGEECPECGRKKVVYQEGCKICLNCGYSVCN